MFSTRLDNFLPISSNLKFYQFRQIWNCHLQTLSLEGSKIYHLVMGLISFLGWKANTMYLYYSNGTLIGKNSCYIYCRKQSLMIPMFSSTGHRPASLFHGLLSVIRSCVNIFFSETSDPILMKFHWNVPAMVLFRMSRKNMVPSKTLVAMATKLKFFWNLWKSFCQKP